MMSGSIKKLQADDWIMVFTVVCSSLHNQIFSEADVNRVYIHRGGGIGNESCE